METVHAFNLRFLQFAGPQNAADVIVSNSKGRRGFLGIASVAIVHFIWDDSK